MRLPPDLAERRAGLAAAVAAGYWRTDPAPEEVHIGGVRCLRFSPSGASRGTLLHMHGGAFRIGCPEQIAPFAHRLAQASAVTVICPAYRLAPEHPFPAGLNDGWAVLRALAETNAPRTDPVRRFRRRRPRRQPHRACPSGRHPARRFSPALPLARPDPSPTPLTPITPPPTRSFPPRPRSEAATLYLQGHPAYDPLASPLLGEVRGYPPTYLSVGAGEVLGRRCAAVAGPVGARRAYPSPSTALKAWNMSP